MQTFGQPFTAALNRFHHANPHTTITIKAGQATGNEGFAYSCISSCYEVTFAHKTALKKEHPPLIPICFPGGYTTIFSGQCENLPSQCDDLTELYVTSHPFSDQQGG